MPQTKHFLNYQIRHLPLFEVNARIEKYHGLLRQELRDRGIHLDFHIWVSDEWFCPDGVPGFAMPFYLFNPRLKKLHRDQMGWVDGRSEKEILKMARHELGHVVDNTFALRSHKQRQQLFGDSTLKYPKAYQPKPYSQNFVKYLGDNYAQSHPDEDFAETFAYWLDPDKSWRFKKLSPKVTSKLELMDEMMRSVRWQEPRLKNSFRIDPIDKNRTLLKMFYRNLQRQRKTTVLKRVDHNLRSAFLRGRTDSSAMRLADFLRGDRKAHRVFLAEQEGIHQYQAEKALNQIIGRADRLGIKAPLGELQAKSGSVLQRNFRYLRDSGQLKSFL